MEANQPSQETTDRHPCKALLPFQTYGWTPQPRLSRDDNFLDLILVLTRNSICRDGGMGCVLASTPYDTCTTNKSAQATGDDHNELYSMILGVATNLPLYSKNDSDVHAEIAALGSSARRGNATQDCTAYITMPPCKRCLAALVMAGVQRLVYFRSTPSYLQEIAIKHNLQLVQRDHTQEQRARIAALISKYYQDNNMDEQEEIEKLRKQRKQEEKERKQRQQTASVERAAKHNGEKKNGST